MLVTAGEPSQLSWWKTIVGSVISEAPAPWDEYPWVVSVLDRSGGEVARATFLRRSDARAARTHFVVLASGVTEARHAMAPADWQKLLDWVSGKS